MKFSEAEADITGSNFAQGQRVWRGDACVLYLPSMVYWVFKYYTSTSICLPQVGPVLLTVLKLPSKATHLPQ